MNYIEIKNLKKIFNENLVLDIQNLNIDKGEIVAIVGKNGSGKSTLLKIISGILFQNSGTCMIDGIDNRNKYIKQISKFVLESGKGYYDYLTSNENILYFLSLNRVKLDTDNSKVLDFYIDYFSFKDNLNKKVSELSQGNRQKLSLIITLMTDPDIICLDEPTNGLDISSINLFMRFLYKISKEKQKTIIFTSHDLSFLRSLNSRVLLIDNGKVSLDRKSDELFLINNLEKTVLEIDIKYIDILKNLDTVKYEFYEEKILISVYDKKDLDYLLSNVSIYSFKKEPLDTEDIFFKVITND